MSNKYAKDVSHLQTLDVYRLQELYQMHPCAEHVVKKLVAPGQRSGGKTLDQDIADCIQTLQRWQAMRAEDAAAGAMPPEEFEEPPAVQVPKLPPLPEGTAYLGVPPPQMPAQPPSEESPDCEYCRMPKAMHLGLRCARNPGVLSKQ